MRVRFAIYIIRNLYNLYDATCNFSDENNDELLNRNGFSMLLII